MAITAAIKALLTMVPADWERCDGTFFDFIALFLPIFPCPRCTDLRATQFQGRSCKFRQDLPRSQLMVKNEPLPPDTQDTHTCSRRLFAPGVRRRPCAFVVDERHFVAGVKGSGAVC